MTLSKNRKKWNVPFHSLFSLFCFSRKKKIYFLKRSFSYFSSSSKPLPFLNRHSPSHCRPFNVKRWRFGGWISSRSRPTVQDRVRGDVDFVSWWIVTLWLSSTVSFSKKWTTGGPSPIRPLSQSQYSHYSFQWVVIHLILNSVIPESFNVQTFGCRVSILTSSQSNVIPKM